MKQNLNVFYVEKFMGNQEKRCIKCGETKNIEDYPIMVKHATVPPKRRAHCKDCDKKLAKQRLKSQ